MLLPSEHNSNIWYVQCLIILIAALQQLLVVLGTYAWPFFVLAYSTAASGLEHISRMPGHKLDHRGAGYKILFSVLFIYFFKYILRE